MTIPRPEASVRMLGGPWARQLLSSRPCQPDLRSCGATIQVVAVALLRDGYARHLLAAPTTFTDEVLGMHRRTTSLVDVAGSLQLPWPRSLGTPPWSVARQLSAITGARYRVDWSARALSADALDAIDRGLPVAIFTGSRWLPRHVELVVGADRTARRLAIYDPAAGRVDLADCADVDAKRLPRGWPRLWFAVRPAPSTAQARTSSASVCATQAGRSEPSISTTKLIVT